MKRSRIVRLGFAIGFLAFGAPLARGADTAPSSSGEGARPQSGFDPTGSHPLPNSGIEPNRRPSSGCGCRL